MAYTTPTPNTDPNNFGTVDQTLDPSMSNATIQSKIDLAGDGGVVQWGGITSASYLINTDLRFLPGQKHFATQGGGIKVKCTNTSSLASFINLRSPKGRSVPSTNVTISDIEFWGHLNVPNRPPTSAPKKIIIPYTGTFLRRVGIKGAAEDGLGGQGDRKELGVLVDTCEIAYNVDSTVDGGQDSGVKLTEYGVKGSPVGSTASFRCCHIHHNWDDGIWWDIGSAGVEVLACEVNNNTRYGIHWEVSIGPVYIRDNNVHDNGDDGIHIVSSARGFCYNNTLGGNAGNGIGMLDDGYPDSRNDLTWASGTLAAAGQNQGYQFDEWFVRGNVLNGDSAKYRAIDSNNNTTTNVDLSTNPRPGVITYSTTNYAGTDATDPYFGGGGGGGGGGGTITITEPVAETVDPNNVQTYSLGAFTPPANSLLVVHAAINDISGGAISGESLHDTGSHTWTELSGSPISVTSSDLYKMRAWWTTTGASPGSMTVTLDGFSQNQNSCVLAVLAFAGADLNAPAQVTVNNTGQTLPNVSLPAAPDATSAVVVFNQIRRNPPAWTPEAGWTTHVNAGTDGPNGVSLWSKTGDQTFTATGTTGASWSLMYEIATTTGASPITVVVSPATEVDTAFTISPSIPKALAEPFIIEADFTTPLDAEPATWTDVTAFVRDFDTRRGRNHELGKMQAGEASITLDNRDRRFDPTNTSSPYYPNLRPMRPMRIRATTSTTTYDLFSGFVEDWGQQWSGPAAAGQGDATCEVRLVDGFTLLNFADITSYGTEVLSDEPLSYWPMDDLPGAELADLGSGDQALTVKTGDASLLASGDVDGPLMGRAKAVWYSGTSTATWGTPTLDTDEYHIKGDITVEAWVYLPSAFNASSDLAPAIFQQGAIRMAFFVDGSRRMKARVKDQDGTDTTVSASTVMTPDEWHHVAWVRIGRQINYYTDGVFVSSSALHLASFSAGDLSIYSDFGTLLGAAATGGRLAHVAVYPRAITPERLAHHATASMGTVAAGQTVDAVISQVLDVIGWPVASRHIGASGRTVSAHVADENALTELQMLAEDTDGGLLFFDGAGDLVFLSADDLRENPDVGTGWGDSTSEYQYSDLVFRYDDQDLFSGVRATAQGLADGLATDATAEDRYGPRVLETSAGVLENQLQLEDRASGLLNRYRNPHLRPETMTVVDSLIGRGRIDKMYGSEIGDRVAVVRRPPGGGTITITSQVEGVSHSSVEQMTQIRTTLNLAPVDDTPWILGDATYGKLGDTTALGW